MFQRELHCSFCGRGENEVAKLVAGVKAYICDECVAIATTIMRESTQGDEERATEFKRDE
ncbi:MAG: ClpX C4-type zinc finger protein [Vicinamibacteria bacterium]